MQVACCQASTSGNDPSHVGAPFSRRSALLAGVSGVAAAQTLSPPPAQAAEAGNSDAVTPVNISAKETVELGQSGLYTAASISGMMIFYICLHRLPSTAEEHLGIFGPGQTHEGLLHCAGLKVSPMGIGAWSFGDRTGYWASTQISSSL